MLSQVNRVLELPSPLINLDLLEATSELRKDAPPFAALMRLEEPKYTIEQIGAKCGKSPAYVAARLRLTELAAPVAEAFAKDG